MSHSRHLVLGLLLVPFVAGSSFAADASQLPGSPVPAPHRTSGLAEGVEQKKPLLVMFTTDGCVYCDKMLQQTYSHPAVERMLLARTETVMAHTRDNAELVQKLGVRGFPTTLLVSPTGEVLQVSPGFVTPKEFMERFGNRAGQAGRPTPR